MVLVSTLPSDVSPLTSIARSFSVNLFHLFLLTFWYLICWSYYTVACEKLVELTTQLWTYKLTHAFFVSWNHSVNLLQLWLVGVGSVQLGWKQSSSMAWKRQWVYGMESVLYLCNAESDWGSSGFLKVHYSAQVEEEPVWFRAIQYWYWDCLVVISWQVKMNLCDLSFMVGTSLLPASVFQILLETSLLWGFSHCWIQLKIVEQVQFFLLLRNLCVTCQMKLPLFVPMFEWLLLKPN